MYAIPCAYCAQDTFGQVLRILKPDAPFIGAMIGGDSLFELR